MGEFVRILERKGTAAVLSLAVGSGVMSLTGCGHVGATPADTSDQPAATASPSPTWVDTTSILDGATGTPTPTPEVTPTPTPTPETAQPTDLPENYQPNCPPETGNTQWASKFTNIPLDACTEQQSAYIYNTVQYYKKGIAQDGSRFVKELYPYVWVGINQNGDIDSITIQYTDMDNNMQKKGSVYVTNAQWAEMYNS